MIIGLTGPAGAGKTVAVKHLTEERGFGLITLSDFVKKEATARGLELVRTNLQTVGNELRKLHGPGAMGVLAKEAIEKAPEKNWVVDGIRNPAEIEVLKSLDNYRTIAIIASVPILIERMQNRKDAKDKGNVEELTAQIMRELGGKEPLDGLRIDLCIEAADHIIENEGTLEELLENLEIAIS